MNLTLTSFLLGVIVVSAQPGRQGDITTAVPSRVSIKDPCEVASAAQLRTALSVGLAQYFPMSESKDGEKVTVSEPSITDVTCPGLRISVKVSMRYQKTRGFPQVSISGTARFRSPVELRITHPLTIGSGVPIPAGDVRSARACVTDINATELNINNVPNWLDNGWLREQVLEPFLQSKCVDVMNLVRLYIQQGGVVKAS